MLVCLGGEVLYVDVFLFMPQLSSEVGNTTRTTLKPEGKRQMKAVDELWRSTSDGSLRLGKDHAEASGKKMQVEIGLGEYMYITLLS